MPRIKEKNKGERGFTLMEVVASVAIVSLISWFILQIFVVSANANIKAQNIDVASSKAQELIELIKSSRFEDIPSLEALADAAGDLSAVREDGSGYWYALWFDKDWEPKLVAPGGEERFLAIVDIHLDERQYSEGTIGEFSSAEDVITRENGGRLMKICVNVYDTSLGEDKWLLVDYETSKYFGN